MEATLTNRAARDQSATRKRKTVNIIIGCHRAEKWTWDDLVGAVLNGAGLIRDGNAFRLCHSEAFQQGQLS